MAATFRRGATGRTPIATLLARRAKHHLSRAAPVNPFPQIYSTLPKFGIAVSIAHPGPGRGAIVRRHERGPGCGGRGCVGHAGVSQRAERTAPTSGEASWRSRKLRTAKPCGPDRRCYGQALRRCFWARPGPEASSIREVTEARRNSAPGRAGISRQTTAQGRPCVGLHLYAAVQFSACAVAQRTMGASRHPAFPAPSLQRGTRKPAKLGRFGPRECRAMCGRLAKRPNLLASPMSLGYQRRAAIAVSSSLTPGPRSATPIAARAGRCSAVK